MSIIKGINPILVPQENTGSPRLQGASIRGGAYNRQSTVINEGVKLQTIGGQNYTCIAKGSVLEPPLMAG